MHISSNEVFQDSEEIIHSAEINDTSYERQADFHKNERKQNFEKANNQKQKTKTKKCHF